MCVAIDESMRPILSSYNPFDDAARPQHSDGRFPYVQVPSVLRGPREQRLAAIGAYRVKQYTSLLELPASRVVKVLGDRDAGTTHLSKAMLHRADRQPQLLMHTLRELGPTDRMFVAVEAVSAVVAQAARRSVEKFEELTAEMQQPGDLPR